MELLEKLGAGFRRLIEMILDKLRINVIIIAMIVAWIVVDFGDKLITLLDKDQVSPNLVITVLVALISTGVGGLIAAMVRMFESPSVPADTFERLMTRLSGKAER